MPARCSRRVAYCLALSVALVCTGANGARGNLVFSNPLIVFSNQLWVAAASDVHAADLDGDGDLDVLSASNGSRGVDDKIAWYRERWAAARSRRRSGHLDGQRG